MTEEVLGDNAQGLIRSYVERLDRLQDDAQAVRDDMKAVRLEAKGAGLDAKILNKLVALQRKNKAKVQEENALLALYANAAGCADLI